MVGDCLEQVLLVVVEGDAWLADSGEVLGHFLVLLHLGKRLHLLTMIFIIVL